jgi:hypothetical protein
MMSPTVLRVKGYRFDFFSREETRPHVHVQHPAGEAKFWPDPTVEEAQNWDCLQRLTAALRLAREHADDYPPRKLDQPGAIRVTTPRELTWVA